MSRHDIEELERVKRFLIENPETAGELFENMNLINKKEEEVPVTMFGASNSLESIGGPRKKLAIPGCEKLSNDNNNGFSNYFLLAIFAFVIQFAITMICIFFYK